MRIIFIEPISKITANSRQEINMLEYPNNKISVKNRVSSVVATKLRLLPHPLFFPSKFCRLYYSLFLRWVLVILFFFGTLSPLAVTNAYVGSGEPKNSNFQLVPCKGVNCDFNALMELANRIIKFLIYISIPLAAISFSYAGYLYLSAAGDTKKIEDAHGIFKKVLIGFILILSAWLIVYTITSALLSSDFKNSDANFLKNRGDGSVDNGGGNGDNDNDNNTSGNNAETEWSDVIEI